MTFSSLGLAEPITKALNDKGYDKPTPIQSQAIPPIISQRDVMAAAQTGSGKTAGFTLPILHKLASGQRAKSNSVRALILVPTRELAAQVEDNVKLYGKYLSLNYAVVFGGVKINPQMMKLRGGVDILVATPGRLMDLYQQNAVRFNQLEILVLDEADRMLDMGFINDIRKILSYLPKERQTLMFSATFSSEIRTLAKGMLHNPVEIDVSPRNSTKASIKQLLHPVDKRQKKNLLTHLIKQNNWDQVLVFTRTKRGANQLTTYLEEHDISAMPIHGNKSQGARTRALEKFKAGDVKVLVATDLAARGIDISDLPHVVNFDMPDVAENYVHRIGRTGRAGKKGVALSLVSADEADVLADIETLIGKLIPREIVDGFEPRHSVPVMQLKAKKPKKIKKPKKKPVSQSNKSISEKASVTSKKTKRSKPKRDSSKTDAFKKVSSKPGSAKPGSAKQDSVRQDNSSSEAKKAKRKPKSTEKSSDTAARTKKSKAKKSGSKKPYGKTRSTNKSNKSNARQIK
jgi:ATP-dependent RNA helicase RhlE